MFLLGNWGAEDGPYFTLKIWLILLENRKFLSLGILKFILFESWELLLLEGCGVLLLEVWSFPLLFFSLFYWISIFKLTL